MIRAARVLLVLAFTLGVSVPSASAQLDPNKCLWNLGFLDAGAFNSQLELGGRVCAGDAAWIMTRLLGFLGPYVACQPYRVEALEVSGTSSGGGVTYQSGNILPTPTQIAPREQRDGFWFLRTQPGDFGQVDLTVRARVVFPPLLPAYPHTSRQTLTQYDAFFEIVDCGG